MIVVRRVCIQWWAAIKNKNKPSMLIRVILKVYNYGSQIIKELVLIYKHSSPENQINNNK
jgi:hypothetical protein